MRTFLVQTDPHMAVTICSDTETVHLGEVEVGHQVAALRGGQVVLQCLAVILRHALAICAAHERDAFSNTRARRQRGGPRRANERAGHTSSPAALGRTYRSSSWPGGGCHHCCPAQQTSRSS